MKGSQTERAGRIVQSIDRGGRPEGWLTLVDQGTNRVPLEFFHHLATCGNVKKLVVRSHTRLNTRFRHAAAEEAADAEGESEREQHVHPGGDGGGESKDGAVVTGFLRSGRTQQR